MVITILVFRFVLEQTFKDYKFLAYSEREELAVNLGLSENQVWYLSVFQVMLLWLVFVEIR